MAFDCSTPRAIVSRWLSSLKCGKDREEGLENRNEWRDKRQRKRKDSEESRVNRSTKCLSENVVHEVNGKCENQKQCHPDDTEGVGQSKNDATFNLGAGFGLAFLIASSKSELNKMMELRVQMESLIQRAKDDLQTLDKVSKSSRGRRTVDYTTTEVESMNSNGCFLYDDHTSSESVVASSKFRDQDLQHGGRNEQWPHVDREIMEIEFESELNHLQLLCESDWHENPGQSSTLEHEGVRSEELALRLYEVLETRQAAQIKELEAALQQALQKLDEKEAEASWWKETAQLFSQRLPEVPTPALRQNSILPAPKCSKRSIKLAEKLSSEILSNR